MPSDDVTWTILIATIGQRQKRFRRVVDQLIPQVNEYDGRVRITALYNHGERSLNEVRADLVESVDTDYLCFVDDDDEVPRYYVDEVMDRIGEVDYVGWQMQCIMNGAPLKPTFHSLKYPKWFEDGRGFYRHVSHLNPIKTKVARKVSYRTQPQPEDVNWANNVRQYVETEAYIGRCMYTYHASSVDTTWRGGAARRVSHPRPDVPCAHFSYHRNSSE